MRHQHAKDGFSFNSVCCCFCFLANFHRKSFYYIRVLEASNETEVDLLSSYKLSYCRSFCWIHSTNRIRNLFNSRADLRQQPQQCRGKYFNHIASNVFFGISIFPCALFAETCICFDLAAPSSRIKHQNLHLQCHFRVDSCVIFRSHYFASCIRLLELLTSVDSNMLFGIFSFNSYLHILFGNPKEAYMDSPAIT